MKNRLSNTPLYSMKAAFRGLEFLGEPVFIGSGDEEDFYILKADTEAMYCVCIYNGGVERYGISLDCTDFETNSQKIAAEKMKKLMLLL
jgi:hypothetical protein